MTTNKINLEIGRALSNKAKKLIPGGAHTYSKGDDQFPANAPKIIDRGKGCYIWDVDGNKWLDFAMSLGSVSLGHAYDPVLQSVTRELEKGVNFLRPTAIEAEVAELLIDIIPSAEMVKFAKHGSDATTSAVKLARAYTSRKYIARCQDDAFNSIDDWFIGSTILHSGVPDEVRELTLQFKYNDIGSLERLFDEYPYQIAGVIFEPLSMIEPEDNFLQKVKLLCEKNGSILIFDEVVSGFRFNIGGAQNLAGVTPHLSAFGKGMANGFSCSALVGQRDIMSLGAIEGKQKRMFLLSTTHGGETHGLAAAKSTIREFQEKNVINHIWQLGSLFQSGVREIAARLDVERYIDVIGYPCKTGLIFRDETGAISPIARTLFLQESAQRGLLIPYISISYSHTEAEIITALKIIEDSLIEMKKAAENQGMLAAVQGAIIKPVFRKEN
ncbi:glutamate-1-semialdehyde 2,1-aminomutase [Polynucleobacter bastaniensis]|uniref:glutamate-1-semialdehyde 2,1-aminomutase n=1 Tax=Polynucleobacter bastaniensis TaxID=2081039 RepID=UPI001C0B341D|nr:glutamate-1-semialdehyde 2,1-aminomutase [Polynucleobacter bastaniensis]MBU3597323.1 glutamate-1-semialdehyde 2,1-aminomutase [Polynucleobacter bastaniensis]